MMGGMGGGMGGGMRSVPPTSLPEANLSPGQTRHLPTRLVSLSPPDPESGVSLPEKGEKLQILGDVAKVSNNDQVQKALRRLAADKAPTTVSQLVMWRLSAGLDWVTIAGMAQKWANGHELTLARHFVDHLDQLPEGETGRILFQFTGTDAAGKAKAAELDKALQGKTVLGLVAEVGVPERPDGPAVACRVRFTNSDALVQVQSSDATARSWQPFGKFTLPIVPDKGTFDIARFSDALTEGILNRLVRTQLTHGPRVKGKPTYQVRIDNASPLVLNGLALLGTASKDDETPKVLSGIGISPRRSMTVPASEDAVKTLGLKNGIRVMALDLSGL
jgi:hypothetical protein